jgi:hypothetical protein
LSVSAGTNVVWKNTGQLTHSIVSDDTANLVPDHFNSGPLSQGGTFNHVFAQQGTYQYYDGYYQFLKGTVYVSPAASATTLMPPISQVGLNGNVGWTVEGLSSDTANLLVSHNLGVSIPVSELPQITITPVTESGTLVQSIDLATRVESAGTATDLIEHIVDAFAAASSSPYGSNSGLGNIISQMSASASSDPSYTIWWVNGPLTNGSPVQVMDGWASVTGSENLDLGSLGTVSAWIVTSQFAQSFNANIPNPSSPLASGSTASASANLNFLWSYDKGSDLLLRSLANTTLTAHSVSNQQISVPNLCVDPLACPVPVGGTFVSVKVTRDMRLVLTLSLHLSDTSLRLDQRMPTSGQPQDLPSLLSSLIATPWSVFGVVGGTAAAIIGLSVWLGQRARKTETSDDSLPPSTGAPPPAPL